MDIYLKTPAAGCWCEQCPAMVLIASSLGLQPFFKEPPVISLHTYMPEVVILLIPVSGQ
jgi:hypothetical protein